MLSDHGQRIQKYLNSTHNLTKSLKEIVRDNIESTLTIVEGRETEWEFVWLWHITKIQSILGSWAVSDKLSFSLKPGRYEELQYKA